MQTPPPSPISEATSSDVIILEERHLNRLDTGYVRSPQMIGSPPLWMEQSISEDNWNSLNLNSDITNSWSPSPRRRLYDRSSPASELSDSTLNLPDPEQPWNMFGNRTPGLGNLSNSVRGQLIEIPPTIGIEYVYWQLPEILRQSPVTFTYDIILISPGNTL